MVLAWDMDALGSLYVDGILHSVSVMEAQHEISVVCCNGIYRWPGFSIYYDTYAHEPIDSFSQPTEGSKTSPDGKLLHDIKHGLLGSSFKRGDPPEEVRSCFSGASLYRLSSMIAARYTMAPSENEMGVVECEHVRLHDAMRGKKVMNPSAIHVILYND